MTTLEKVILLLIGGIIIMGCAHGMLSVVFSEPYIRSIILSIGCAIAFGFLARDNGKGTKVWCTVGNIWGSICSYLWAMALFNPKDIHGGYTQRQTNSYVETFEPADTFIFGYIWEVLLIVVCVVIMTIIAKRAIKR